MRPRECCEFEFDADAGFEFDADAEFEFDAGADPDGLRAECGLTCDRIEYSEPSSETDCSRGYTIVEG